MNIYSIVSERTKDAGDFLLSPTLEPLYQYADLERLSSGYANTLTEAGVMPGDRVMVQVDKSPACLFLYFACLRAGAIYLPLNTAYLDDELTYFVANAAPSVIVCDPSREAFFNALPLNASPDKQGTRRVMTLDKNGQGSMTVTAGDGRPFTTIERDADDTAVILYTSGTTGRPKGAMITHGNLAVNALALLDAWRWQPGDIMLHALPIFHIHGLFVGTHLPILNGSPIIFLNKFDPDEVTGLLQHATVYMGVPTHYTRLLDTGKLTRHGCNDMRLFTCGSAPLLPQTFEAFEEQSGHRIVERYGMTETGMNTSNPIDGARKPGTVGPPLPGVDIRIIDDQGQALAPGQPGDLLVKGDNVFKGYWKMPEKTAEEFIEGYFKTGDVASIDEDGYVSIVGRNKDMIISGGLNVYPKEIEAVIDELEGVVESAVIGLPHPDFGEGVCAVIVGSDGLSEEKIVDSLKSKLANFKIPKWIHFVPELPRNTMGKVQKNVLREQFAS